MTRTPAKSVRSGVERGKVVLVKLQEHVRHLLRDGAQDEEGETEEKLSKEANRGWRFAADAARIPDEGGSEASGGVFVAIDSGLGVVVCKAEGTVMSIPGNVRSCVRFFFLLCTSGIAF